MLTYRRSSNIASKSLGLGQGSGLKSELDRSRGKDGFQTNNGGTGKKVSNINLKHECEIIYDDPNSLQEKINFVVGEQEIQNELQKFKIRNSKNGLMVLDLHNTADLFLRNEDILAKLAEFREKFGLVVILSFVGKTDSPTSTRNQARGDIKYLISKGVADLGLFVFQRGPAKGWMCNTLSSVFRRGIYFSDDSEDHLESVRKTLNPLSIHESDPTKSQDLFDWIQKCSCVTLPEAS
jgi:hypothetical protein